MLRFSGKNLKKIMLERSLQEEIVEFEQWFMVCCAVKCVAKTSFLFVFFLVFSWFFPVFFFSRMSFFFVENHELAVLALSSGLEARASWLSDYLGRMRTAIRTSFCKARALHAAYPSALALANFL